MTANELANEVMEHYRAELPRGFNVNWMEDVAIMLRQQQAEIEKLGSELDRIVELYTDKAIKNEALEKELALQKLSDIGQAIERELTDEEIRTIQDMCHLKNVGYNTFIMRFARAILKKASEK